MRKTVIEPNGKNLQYWRDIWNYRELAYNLAKRDITVRYKQTRIGLGWAVIAPIISMFDSMISIVVLLVMMLIVGYYPTVRFLLFPVFLLLNAFLGLFTGLFLSSFNVKWRDMAQIVPFALSILQYACPVSYSMSSIPEKYRLIYSLNPVTGMISAFKWCVIGDMSFDTLSFLVAMAWLVLLAVFGIILFRRTERNFVDIV